jgi:hypothetical protein
MTQSYIRIRDDTRIKVEVLDDGSVLVSLEQTIGRSTFYDSSWQAVKFRRWPAFSSGYRINPPGKIATWFGDTLEKRVRAKIKKCQTVAHQINTAKHTVAKIVPPDEETNVEKLAKRIGQRTLQRIQHRFLERREGATDEEVEALERFLNQAIDRIVADPHFAEQSDTSDVVEALITTLQMLPAEGEGGRVLFRSDAQPNSQPDEEQKADTSQTEASPNRLDDIIIEQDDEGNAND